MIRRAHHLSDDRLLDCYLNERDGTTLDPRLAEHLADCPACGRHYAELARFMDTVRSEAERETDAIFTAERLRQQQQQIGSRIEHSSRAGRIISFPSQASRRILAVSSEHRASRWIAASAAAGLFVGVALGASYRWDVSPRAPIGESATARLAPLAPAVPRTNASQNADDVFMSELEVALDRPRTRELIAIDALTPHFREVRAAY